MAGPIIQTADLENTFRALRSKDPRYVERQNVPYHPDYKTVPNQNYAPTTSVQTGWGGGGMQKYASASASGGIVYGQPQFFSPVHTPINWQIPSKRLEIYQWMFLPCTQVLREDFTYSDLENAPFICNNIIEDSLTGGFVFETSNYPKIMNSEGVFNQPPRISMRDCENKRCFSFEPLGNYRRVRISEEHHIYVLDGLLHRRNRKVIGGKKYRSKKGIVPNGVEKVKIQNKLIKRIQAHEVKRSDYLLTPLPQVGKISINKDMAWLIGFCVADGCIAVDGTAYSVNFTGCKDEKALIRCQEILEANFDSVISSKQHGDGKGWRVAVTTKKAHDFFRTYIVNKGIEKKFSKAVFDTDMETRLNILAGYFDGDGSFSKAEKKLIANCYSQDLADQIYWLLISCKIGSSLGRYPLYGEHYPTTSEFCYRVFMSASQTSDISGRMNGDKVPTNYIPKKERELKFFYTEDEITYLAQPIDKIEEFLYTGKGFDIEMTNERKALVADGYVCSNSRFFYQNEPKVASAIDFYSYFPVNDYEHECKDRNVKKYFDRLKKRLGLVRWLRLLSHEVHLLGDCFPFTEIQCPTCDGVGRVGDEICEHDGGTIRRIVILNPDYVDVYTSPMNPEPVIAMRPDEELINMIQKRSPGYDRVTPEVRALIAAGKPIRLDNRSVSHIKYGECGYDRYGIGMVRRLFPILSYKTKLMVAQWIVAERLIIPIRIVKVGSDERPAGPADISAVQSQLAQTANDPNLTIVTHHAFELIWEGACYDDQTEVLTENGWKKYGDVSKNHDEKIATYNLNNDQIEFDVPVEYHEFDFKGEMCYFKAKHYDTCVTPNHNMLVQTRQWNPKENRYSHTEWTTTRADQVIENSRFKTTVGWHGNVPADLPYKNEYLLSALSLRDYLEFVGYYLSEGGLQRGEKNAISGEKAINCVHITQKEDSPYFESMKKSIYSISSSITDSEDRRSSPSCWQFRINDCKLAREIAKNYGDYSNSKHIPKWILDLPCSELKVLLDALIKGDGNFRSTKSGKERYKYTTVSKQLADAVQEIVLKMGYDPKIKTCIYKNPKHQKKYIIFWSEKIKEDNCRAVKDRNIFKQEYDGKVWCFTVKNSFFVTRRNGKIAIHGNSGKVLALSNEFEFINQEILDGLMINNALLNGEGPCFHPDVEILTENGWKHYDEVADDEQLATFNPETKAMEFQPFLNRIVKQYDGDMVNFRTNKIEMVTTTNHRMWVQERTSKNKKEAYSEWKVVSAEDVKHRSRFRACVDDWEGGIPEEYKDGVQVGDNHIKDLASFVAMAGYYISEGWANIKQAGIAQKTGTEVEAKIRNCLNLTGIHYNDIPKKDGMTTFNFRKNVALWFMKNIPGHSKERRIPKWIRNLPKPYLAVLFDALIEGDGCWHKRSKEDSQYKSYITGSKELADDVLEISLKLGYASWISYVREEEDIYVVNIPSSDIGKFPVLDTLIFGDKVAERKKCIQRTPYKGTVWCFEVPNEFLVVRLRGKPMIAGNTFANASIGVEAMYERLDTFRKEIALWVEEKIYLPEAKRQGFIDEEYDGDDEDEKYIYPKIKWNRMNLRDQQQYRNFVLQLFEKGLLSAQTVLEAFDFDPDNEIEKKRYDALSALATAGPAGAGGRGGVFGGAPGGGGGGGGGGGDLGGLLGAGAPPGGGGEAPISAPPGGGGEMGGGAPAAGPTASESSRMVVVAQATDPSQYGGKILKPQTREKLDREREKIYKKKQTSPDGKGTVRDEKGRVIFTKCERQLIARLRQYQESGLIRYQIVPQFRVQYGSDQEFPIDFAIPNLKIGLEADGEIFHSSPKQVTHDHERDRKLAQLGWTILRFQDKEIEEKIEQVMSTVMKTIMQKEAALKQQVAGIKK